MITQSIDHHNIAAFLQPKLHPESTAVEVQLRRLRGGLESAGVWNVIARFQTGPSRWQTRRLVLKCLAGSDAREAKIYRSVLPKAAAGLSPGFFGAQSIRGECRLFLEAVHPAVPWPWRDTRHSISVLRCLARLHATAPAARSSLPDWNYQAEVMDRAQALLQFAEQSRVGCARRNLPALRRLVMALPEIRNQLLNFTSLPPALIHGDVHPGNVLMKRSATGLVPVLVDWARSRIGSPLEDVSSWLQSLGYWEPEARRRHDTLLALYLAERGESSQISRALRDAYWLAAASNLLAGALLYHLARVTSAGPNRPSERASALRAVQDCLRVIRRADECWSTCGGEKLN